MTLAAARRLFLVSIRVLAEDLCWSLCHPDEPLPACESLLVTGEVIREHSHGDRCLLVLGAPPGGEDYRPVQGGVTGVQPPRRCPQPLLG